MKLPKLLMLPLMLVAQITIANAESAVRNVGGVNLDLPAPNGFCIADENNFVDAQFVNVVRNLLQGAQNKLIMTTIACDTLHKFRQHAVKKVTDYALYYTPFQIEHQTFPGDQTALRKSICNQMREQGSISLDAIKDIIAQKAKEMGQNIGVNSTKLLGVIDEDQHGCYTAMLIGMRDARGENTIMSSIVTSTVLRGKPIFFAYYGAFAGPETTTAGVQAAKALAAELDALNQ